MTAEDNAQEATEDFNTAGDADTDICEANDANDAGDAGRDLPRNNRGLRIEREDIASLPLGQYTGTITVVETAEAAREAVARLRKEAVLGFDTESRPAFRRGEYYLPSLVQLAGENEVCIFRLDACGGVPVLFPIFRDANILKVGVAVRDDVYGLQDRAPFDAAGFIEISRYTRKGGIENTGLRALAAHFLGLRISKGEQVTNWASPHLSPKQITYAATDAWISRSLYVHIQSLGMVTADVDARV